MDVDADLTNPPGLTAFHTSDYFDYLRRGRHHDRLPGSAVGIVGPDGGGGVVTSVRDLSLSLNGRTLSFLPVALEIDSNRRIFSGIIETPFVILWSYET